MAMPKKSSRLISVGGTSFRWRARGSDTVELRVELTDKPASQLCAYFEYVHVHAPGSGQHGGGFSDAFQMTCVSPGVVHGAIDAALKLGWEPSSKQPREFRLDLETALKLNKLATERGDLGEIGRQWVAKSIERGKFQKEEERRTPPVMRLSKVPPKPNQ